MARGDEPSHPTDAQRVRFLASPAALGAGPVETIETHMSWVFRSAGDVLKLKKPVRYPFLDFSTLAAREASCREEVRLNSRLAPGVYRGVMALQWRDGALSLVPEDRIDPAAPMLDWLVHMRRLPEERMLDRLIADGRLDAGDIDALVVRLAAFYRSAPRITLAPADYLRRFEREQAINRELLLRPQFDVPGAAEALDRLDAALRRDHAALEARAAAGRLVDGHGDLRPEHVCLLDPPVVIDGLEFNATLRQVDPFDELAFLGMECDVAGAPWIGVRLVDGCAAALGERPAGALLALYAACRAVLRARLAMAHLLDPEPRTPLRWPALAAVYLRHALRSLDRCAPGASGTP